MDGLWTASEMQRADEREQRARASRDSRAGCCGWWRCALLAGLVRAGLAGLVRASPGRSGDQNEGTKSVICLSCGQTAKPAGKQDAPSIHSPFSSSGQVRVGPSRSGQANEHIVSYERAQHCKYCACTAAAALLLRLARAWSIEVQTGGNGQPATVRDLCVGQQAGQHAHHLGAPW